MENDGPLYTAARHGVVKNQMCKSAETEAFTCFSEIWFQFQMKSVELVVITLSVGIALTWEPLLLCPSFVA